MGSSNTDYQAKIVRESLNGVKLPSIKQIVKDIVLNSDTELKKEEMDEYVCRQIGFPMDESISGATSQALDKLKSENIAKNVSHGYWRKY